MRLKKAAILEIGIPFRFTFRHALAERSRGKSILVRLEDEDGHVGWGESAPRPYVTGESTDTASGALRSELFPELLRDEFPDFSTVKARIATVLETLPRDQQAAFCAVELALLDLAGRVFGESIASLIGPVVHDTLTFSAVISADGVEHARKALELVSKFGFTSLKLKIGISTADDKAILEAAREVLGEDVGLRVDANCCWQPEEALAILGELSVFRLEGVEQPIPSEDIDGLAWLTSRSPVPVITDESLASYEDARRLVARQACHVFNIRISKCGGLLNSVRIRDLAQRSGMKCMLGAQVGETAILSAAGRHFAARTKGLQFLEGSYGTILLESDIATRDLTIGSGGRAEALDGLAPGLGIEVKEELVEPHVENRIDLAIGDF